MASGPAAVTSALNRYHERHRELMRDEILDNVTITCVIVVKQPGGEADG